MELAAAIAPPGPDPQTAPALHPNRRITLRDLSVVAEGEEFLIGDPVAGVFLSVPEVGVVALRSLQAGATIGEAAAAAERHAGLAVDVLDFTAALVEAGLVVAVDGVPLQAADAARAQSWLEHMPPAVVRPFFSATAWTIYGGLFVGCLALFIARPHYWPSFEDTFFYPDPAVCIVVLTLSRILLGAIHEVCHWMAGRAVGVAARFNISRRLFFPVFETDLSQLWSVARGQRYSAFLAGMAFDVVVLAVCLGLRVLGDAGVLDLPPLLHRFLGALALGQVLALGWQTQVFLRTDLYAVLVTALGCRNLYQVTTLWLKQRLWRLSAREAGELADAHPRDRQVARWFGWLYLAGFAWATYIWCFFIIPGTLVLAGWMFGSLGGAPLGSATFWEALIIGLVAAAQAILPLGMLCWQRLRQRMEARS